MRFAVSLFLFASLAYGADYVTVVTKDGRSLTGYYDSEEGTVTLAKPKATIRVRADEIASVTAAASPEQSAAKGGGDIIAQLKGRISALESDRDKAAATARRYRNLAGDARNPDEAQKLSSNAEASDAEARGYQLKIDEVAAKVAQLEGDKVVVAPVEARPRISQIGQLRIDLEAAQDRATKAQQEVVEMRQKLNRAIAEVNRDFIVNGDLEPVGFSSSARPTKEENDKAARISNFNQQLETLRGIREQWKRVGSGRRADDSNAFLFPGDAGMQQTDRFWQSYAELKGKPAPY